ncbi:MAG: hydrogenase maturation protease [Ignavibacteriae bacterium]|nr:hydrogenase maturation protease [Ignavibacteriota bacterium]
MSIPGRKVVVGIGEILAGDHGLGKHALRLLKMQNHADRQIEFVEAGTAGFDLEQIIEDCTHLLVLDAADANRTPGTIIEFSCDSIHLYDGLRLMAHQAEFHHVMKLACKTGRLPLHMNFMGMQPNGLAIGLELSPAVEAAMPEMIRRAATILRSWKEELVAEEE